MIRICRTSLVSSFDSGSYVSFMVTVGVEGFLDFSPSLVESFSVFDTSRPSYLFEMKRSSKRDFLFAISFFVCLLLLKDRAEILVALSLDFRLAISMDRIEILSSINKPATLFRADLPDSPEVDIVVSTDDIGDGSPHVVKVAFGYGIQLR